MPPGQVHIGVSGWQYPEWRTSFYPPGLPHAYELEYAASVFGTIEVNGTFYSLKRPRVFADWCAVTPPECIFAIKGSRYVTHVRRLRDIETPLANFFAQGLLALDDKLGPFLWQFPPFMPFKRERFAAFFRLLPRTTAAAARLATRHDERLAGRDFNEPSQNLPLRHALEVRHPSFDDESFYALLRREGIGLVVADTGGRYPMFDEQTAELTYVRLHGPRELYGSRYTPAELDGWARRIERYRAFGQVYVYFDNDQKAYAPLNALELRERVGPSARARGGQGELREQP